MSAFNDLTVSNKCCMEFMDYFEDQQKTHTFMELHCQGTFGYCPEKSWCLKIAKLYKQELDKRRDVGRVLNAARV